MSLLPCPQYHARFHSSSSIKIAILKRRVCHVFLSLFVYQEVVKHPPVAVLAALYPGSTPGSLLASLFKAIGVDSIKKCFMFSYIVFVSGE